MENKSRGGSFAFRGRRYSPAERAEILPDAAELGVAAAAEKHGCSPGTIYDWRDKEKRAAERQAESDQAPWPDSAEGAS